MSKRSIAVKAAQKAGIPQSKMQYYFDLLLEVLKDTLEEEQKITIANFGTFQVTTREKQNFTNNLTGESYILPEKKVVKFKANKNIIKV